MSKDWSRFQIKHLRKLFGLSPRERVLLAQAWGLFLLVEIGLRILSFKRLLAFCESVSLTKPGDSSGGGLPGVPRLVWLVEVAGRYAPVRATCLKKALVLSWLLGRRGIRTGLRIGVARQQGGLKAHAWLEYEGRILFGHRESDRYEVLLHA